MTAPAKVMLVAEPPAGPKVAEHLLDYADVALVRPKSFTTVPAGTEWVLVMNGGARGSHIRSDALKVGARVVAIPPGWSAARVLLDKAGFFKAFAAVNTGRAVAEHLTHRPLAGLVALAAEAAPDVASALRVEGAADRAVKVLTEVVEKVQEAAAAAQAKAEETVATLETIEAEQTNVKGLPPSPVTGYGLSADDVQKGIAVSTARRAERHQKKLEILRLVFQNNPEASIEDAMAALRTMGPDGRAISWQVVSGIRREIRVAKGLPDLRPTPPPASPAEQALAAAEREGNPVKVEQAEAALLASRAVPSLPPPPAAPPQTAVAPPPVPLAGATLPPDVETAARLLREALEASGAIATYNLTYVKGQRPRQRWTATVENDSEV